MKNNIEQAKQISIRYPRFRETSRILVGAGIIGDIPGFIDPLPDRVFIIADDSVARLYADRVVGIFGKSGVKTSVLTFRSGEGSKTRKEASRLQDALILGGAERGSCVTALGGGVCCDLAGFVAASVMRGLRLVLIPTTLVAMIDAAIGGKVAINHVRGKNLIGFFHPAESVLVDTRFLRTLPAEEWKNGLVELVKIAVVADEGLFASIASNPGDLRKHNINKLDRFIHRAIELKSEVVEKDPYERDQRAVLNFGHTIGHAIEKASGHRLSHGKAVSIGMVLESRMAVKLGIMPQEEAVKIEQLLTSLGLSVKVPKAGASDILKFLYADKKRKEGRIYFSLPRRIGKMAKTGSAWGIPVDRDEVAALLRSAGCSV